MSVLPNEILNELILLQVHDGRQVGLMGLTVFLQRRRTDTRERCSSRNSEHVEGATSSSNHLSVSPGQEFGDEQETATFEVTKVFGTSRAINV